MRVTTAFPLSFLLLLDPDVSDLDTYINTKASWHVKVGAVAVMGDSASTDEVSQTATM
jgi:hypothetical protein